MSEHKRYTVEDFHIAAQQVCDELYTNPFADMLRQAADAEEENAKLRETINADSASMAGKDAVIEQLRARLEAVVKQCENIVFDRELKHQGTFFFVEIDGKKMPVLQGAICETVNGVPVILCAARGEGGAK